MKGVKEEWLTLPKRLCDDCGTKYKPKQPVREKERGFCSATCRKAYHKHGGAYRKLRVEVVKLVAREVARQIIDEIMPLYNDLAVRVLALEGSKPAPRSNRSRPA